MTRMFLNGTAMSGQADHGLVASATLVGPRRTAPRYRFVAVRDEFPGLLPVPTGGASIAGELYEMSEELLRDSLLPGEPAELELGTVELDTGEVVHAMQLRPERLRPGDKIVDIADPANPADRGFPFPAATLLFDEHAARHLSTAGRFPPSTLAITGSARLDELAVSMRAVTEADTDRVRRGRRAAPRPLRRQGTRGPAVSARARRRDPRHAGRAPGDQAAPGRNAGCV